MQKLVSAFKGGGSGVTLETTAVSRSTLRFEARSTGDAVASRPGKSEATAATLAERASWRLFARLADATTAQNQASDVAMATAPSLRARPRKKSAAPGAHATCHVPTPKARR